MLGLRLVEGVIKKETGRLKGILGRPISAHLERVEVFFEIR